MLSHILDGLTLVQNGVDATRRNASMVVDANNNGASYLGKVANNQNVNMHEMPVHTVLLSDVVDAILAKLDYSTQMVIKMDIEGFECNAFLGSPQVLTSQQSISIVAVIMEWTFQRFQDRCTSEKAFRLKSLFLDAGYIPFYLHNQTLVRLNVERHDWERDVVWLKDKNMIRNLCQQCISDVTVHDFAQTLTMQQFVHPVYYP